MTASHSKEDIRAFLIAKTGLNPAKAEDSSIIVGSGLVDSFGLVALLAEIEQRFGVFPDLMSLDPAEYATLGGLTKIVSTALNLPETEATPSSPAGAAATASSSSGPEIQRLAKGSPEWQQVPALMKEMFQGFAGQGLRLPLVEGGEKLWLQSLERLPESVFLVLGASVGGQLVSFASAHCKMLPAHLGGGMVGEISYVYVKPEARRHGLAGRMVAQMEDWLKSSKVRSIEIQVLTGNEGALAFWRRSGFGDELVQMRK
ncbi:GNAT family N-acetyltransferase [Prosthecobacter dejongeii]|uniref:Ribosomal protein S18 acetylase RimI-like enzyme/acyl carrier protein n=1 Tax=Prosthecobacter dejongeii TaxID=48465 RepID=A0A7W7YM36_9BACT|nr:GNAT family N-acetyltransferase [Prosthecobacter dejongeii]MBB5038634.1 ribosomal protein S18 acetylase RimI-like enzyme/acyl carrier protein [Prosthecobacter dejongeii]